MVHLVFHISKLNKVFLHFYFFNLRTPEDNLRGYSTDGRTTAEKRKVFYFLLISLGRYVRTYLGYFLVYLRKVPTYLPTYLFFFTHGTSYFS
jgi:hypothetical protein